MDSFLDQDDVSSGSNTEGVSFGQAGPVGSPSGTDEGPGLNLANSVEVCVSIRAGKGTNLALQMAVLCRGRYGRGPHKLNVSKSGFSISTKTSSAP